MDAIPTGSGCHKPLPANAPQGLCPECLLKAGLGTGVDTVQGSCSLISSGFGFDLSGRAGQTVVIEASTNLTSWTPILSNSTGCFHFNDCGSTNCAHRFYRVRLTP